jgi:hypothetical protein
MDQHKSSSDPTRIESSGADETVRMPAPRDIEVVRARDLPYEAYLREYVRSNRPVVIDGAAAQWPAMQRWTPAYFRDRFGDETVQVSYKERMVMRDFVDAVLDSSQERPGPYLFRAFLHEHLPGLLADLSPENPYIFAGRFGSALIPERWWRPDGYLKLLMGGVGSKFPVMHYDLEHAHAQITEIYGDKEFYLFAPEDGPNLYPRAVQSNWSQVEDPANPDLQRFPLMAQATPYRAVLKPGQTIFVPMLWWHAARPLTVSISVCTNTLERSNWREFVHDVCSESDAGTAKRLLKRGYLETAGILMHAMEDFQNLFPAIAKALRLPGLISPAGPEFHQDPSTRQLRFRIPVA